MRAESVYSVHTKQGVLMSYCCDVVWVGNSEMYNKVHLPEFLCAMYPRGFWVCQKHLCSPLWHSWNPARPSDDRTSMYSSEENQVSPLSLISLEDLINYSFCHILLIARCFFVKQHLYKVSQEKTNTISRLTGVNIFTQFCFWFLLYWTATEVSKYA